MYLFFDVETAGQPKNWKAPHTDTFNWPRMVRIAWIVFNEERKPTALHNYIIKPEGFEIPIESEQIHKISTAVAAMEGTKLEEVLNKFAEDVKKVKYVVAHNLHHDENVLGAEFARKGIEHQLFLAERYCIMREGTYFCRLKGRGGKYKWPKLNELYLKLFGKKIIQLENPEIDAKASAVCFFRLVDLEEIDLE